MAVVVGTPVCEVFILVLMTYSNLVDRVVDAYLRAADAEAPGVVDGLYLEGSVALGDFRPRSSDIDFVAVIAGAITGPEISALERAHARLRSEYPRPFFDGMYVTWDDLRWPASEVRPLAGSHEGRFCGDADGPPSPVTWHTIAKHGVAFRGPEAAELGVPVEPDALAAWVDTNLDQYWGRLLQHAARLGSPWGLATLTAYGTCWIVTGVSRLHYTLATGEITSKEGACQHALATFPDRWHRIVREALRIRRADHASPDLRSAATGFLDHLRFARSDPRRSFYRSPLARRRDVLGFARTVITSGHELYAQRRSI